MLDYAASRSDRRLAYLGVFTALEKGSNANETDIVVPHHGVLLLIVWNLEGVLKYYYGVRQPEYKNWLPLPSKLSRPVFSKKLFFSLLYGM